MSTTDPLPVSADPVPASSVEPQDRVPPPGEEIHMPGPTLLPILTAAGITGIVIGTTIWWVWSAVGALTVIICVFRWVSDTSRDVASLPEEHQH